jgi:tRNA U34 5-methylaminomethyl-2-thiouridine-forming methyltransferase MnmC
MPDNQKLQISEDGSHTLISEKFQVTYHSIHGAITESNVVFIDAGLNFLFKNNYSSISVFEMGFGTGLNALLTYIWAEKNQVNIVYHTVEAYPVSKDISDQLNYGEILGYQEILQKLHGCAWETEINFSPYFSFCKYQKELEDLDLKTTCDVVYFDAFSPASQPQLWETPILGKMYDLLNYHGVLVSYCAQGAFKRNLKSVGFRVEAIPGPPGKREMTRANKDLSRVKSTEITEGITFDVVLEGIITGVETIISGD